MTAGCAWRACPGVMAIRIHLAIGIDSGQSSMRCLMCTSEDGRRAMVGIGRRLDGIAAHLGDDEGVGYGPFSVITLTRTGERRERDAIDRAITQLRAEARARRCQIAYVMARVADDGVGECECVPWCTPGRPWRE